MRQSSHLQLFSYKDCCIGVEVYGPPVGISGDLYFVHGRFGNSESWSPVVEGLCQHYRCLLLDLPGFGRSYSVRDRGLTLVEHAELLDQLIRHFSGGDIKVVLIGHDIGAAVIHALLANSPDRATSLVLLNPTLLMQPSPANKWGWGWSLRWKLLKLLSRADSFSIEARNKLLYPWKIGVSRRTMIEAIHVIAESWPGQFERRYWKESLKKIKQPALVLSGVRDFLNPSRSIAESASNFQESYYFERENCGHWPQLEDPDWVISKLKEFLFWLEPITVQKSLSR